MAWPVRAQAAWSLACGAAAPPGGLDGGARGGRIHGHGSRICVRGGRTRPWLPDLPAWWPDLPPLWPDLPMVARSAGDAGEPATRARRASGVGFSGGEARSGERRPEWWWRGDGLGRPVDRLAKPIHWFLIFLFF